jgi:hypothetical protein
LWEVGRDREPILPWSSFLQIWKEHFPLLKIRRPCEDTCGECVRLRNSFRVVDRVYAARQRQNRLNEAAATSTAADDADDRSEQSAPNDAVNETLNVAGNDIEEDLFNVLIQQEFPEEQLIVEANEHILHAQAQRELARLRTQEAKGQRLNPHEDRRLVFLFFFCFCN